MIFGAFELILVVFGRTWWVAALLVFAMLLVATVVVYLTLFHLGYYVNPVSVGAVAIVIKVLNLFFRKPEKAAE